MVAESTPYFPLCDVYLTDTLVISRESYVKIKS